MTIPLRVPLGACIVIHVLAAVLLSLCHTVSLADDSDVEAAIRRGVLYIQRQQLSDGCWHSHGHRLGETALAGLALLAAGERSDSEAVVSAARAVRHLAISSNETYGVSLAVMFLDRIGHVEDSVLIKRLGERLADGQAADGCWTYSLDGQAGSGDNSNAQFAVLACWICRRHGVALDASILRADRYFRSTVNRTNGGWGYTRGSRSTPTMTCAGLVALAAERGVMLERIDVRPVDGPKSPIAQDGSPRDLVPKGNDAVAAAALDYLALQLRQDRIEPQSKSFAGLYFYWSLERVAVIYGLTQIRGVEWYKWGTERLLRKQRPDGSWGEQKCVDTAFAILFLSRVNIAEDLTNVLGGGGHDNGLPKAPQQDTFLRVERNR